MIWAFEDEENKYKKAKLKVKIGQAIKQMGVDERKESYSQKVLKIYNDYEETVFNLSEQTNNETIESIKRMSLGQRMKLQELISKRNAIRNRSNGKEV